MVTEKLGRRNFLRMIGTLPFVSKVAVNHALDTATKQPSMASFIAAGVTPEMVNPGPEDAPANRDDLWSLINMLWDVNNIEDVIEDAKTVNQYSSFHPSIQSMKSWSPAYKAQAESELRVKSYINKKNREKWTRKRQSFIEGMMDSFRGRGNSQFPDAAAGDSWSPPRSAPTRLGY